MKDTLSSCSDLDEQEIQQLHKQAKILKKNSLNTSNALKTTTQRLERQTFTYCSLFQQAFARLFHIDVRTFKSKNECNDKRTFGDDTDIRPSYDTKSMVEVPYTAEYNVFVVDTKHSEQPECIINTCVVEKADRNVTLDSPDMCDNETQTDHNVVECDDVCVALANLIANLKLDIDENKTIQKQLKKANSSLTQELKECKSTLAETSRTLGESNSIRDSFLVVLQNKHTELKKYMAFNDRTVNYDKLKRKLNETLGLLAQKDIGIKEGLKLKAYEISVVQEKHDELVKQSLLTKSHYEGLVKEKTKVITDLKLKEEKDIDKMISMENQLKFLNEIVYKRSQSIQTIHMLAPKCPTFNGRPTFANPMYLKKAQYEKPCLYEIPHDQSDPANRLILDKEEILTLEEESRSKLNKDLVKPYDYTKLNSLYEIFKPPTQEYQIQLAHANEIRKKMWRKSFVKTKPNIFKNIAFLLVSKSISKSRQAYNVMTNNINHLRELVDQAWVNHSKDHFRAPMAKDMEILIKTCLMPLALKTQNDSFAFVHKLKKEMHADLKYVESLEIEIDELESDKAEFSNMYDMLLQELKECECLAQQLLKQTESVSKEVYTELLRSFAKFEKHSISLELALQQCQEQMKNNTVCKEKALNVFLKEREQYFEIQDLKVQLQDNDIAISELKKLIKKNKGKGVDTNFEKQSILGKPPLQPIRNQPVVRQPTAYKFKRSQLTRHRIASQVGMSNYLTKPVTPHSWPQVRKSSFAKPYDVNAPGPSRNSPKHVSFQSPREFVGSNDMVYNYYLKEAKKKAQLQKDKALNTKPSVQQSVRLPNTANGNKPKPRNFNQQPRNWPPSMSSRVNSRVSAQKKDAQSDKTTKRYIPVEKKSDSKNHGRQIPIGQRFYPNKSSNVYLKTTPLRSDLTWKPTGRIFTHVDLKWIPIKKPVETSYNMNNSVSPLGKKTHNPNTTISANSSSLSA
ncbi:hypothetical protein Tco_0917032, partial [Tanacetum coccineum]